jgi:hypothetical protein
MPSLAGLSFCKMQDARCKDEEKKQVIISNLRLFTAHSSFSKPKEQR